MGSVDQEEFADSLPMMWLQSKAEAKGQKLTFVLAEVDWFKAHPEKNWFPDPLGVWRTDFESQSEMCFIPAQRIQRQCLTVQCKVKINYIWKRKGCCHHSIDWKIYLMN